MNLLPIVLVLLALGGGITFEQNLDRYETFVGENVGVIFSLTNTGDSVLEVEIIADLPEGVITENPEIWVGTLFPGDFISDNYTIWAERPGRYEIATTIAYQDQKRPYPALRSVDELIVSEEAPPGAPPRGDSPFAVPKWKDFIGD
jgi:hypothetical protein